MPLDNRTGFVKIFCSDGKWMLQTSCATVEDFWNKYADAQGAVIRELLCRHDLKNISQQPEEKREKLSDELRMIPYLCLLAAWPIALRLGGYKAEGVREQRLISAGDFLPDNEKLFAWDSMPWVQEAAKPEPVEA